MSDPTPGDWFVYQKSGYTRLFVGSDTHDICEMNHAGDEAREDANAALIAAAPELLRGCQAAIAYLADPRSKFKSNRDDARDIIMAAIAASQKRRRW